MGAVPFLLLAFVLLVPAPALGADEPGFALSGPLTVSGPQATALVIIARNGREVLRIDPEWRVHFAAGSPPDEQAWAIDVLLRSFPLVRRERCLEDLRDTD